MCGMAVIILKKKNMSILTIYPNSVLRIGPTLEWSEPSGTSCRNPTDLESYRLLAT
jgi:hypothetical protein